jgi:hypothetical protein
MATDWPIMPGFSRMRASRWKIIILACISMIVQSTTWAINRVDEEIFDEKLFILIPSMIPDRTWYQTERPMKFRSQSVVFRIVQGSLTRGLFSWKGWSKKTLVLSADVVMPTKSMVHGRVEYPSNTLPSQWFLTRTRLYAYQPLLQITEVSSKEGAVIGPVLGTRKFHQTHK